MAPLLRRTVMYQGFPGIPPDYIPFLESNAIVKDGTISNGNFLVRVIILSLKETKYRVAAASSYLQSGVFPIMRYFMLLGSSILIIIWLNLSNDMYDFDTGADKNKKESVMNLAGSRTGTLLAAYACLLLGFVGLTWVSVEVGNLRTISLLACAIFVAPYIGVPTVSIKLPWTWRALVFRCVRAFHHYWLLYANGLQQIMKKMNHWGYIYKCSKFETSVSSLPLTLAVLCTSALVGFTTSFILFCSHFHQVWIGTEKGSMVVKTVIVTIYLVACIWPYPESAVYFHFNLLADITNGIPRCPFCQRQSQGEQN